MFFLITLSLNLYINFQEKQIFLKITNDILFTTFLFNALCNSTITFQVALRNCSLTGLYLYIRKL